MSAVAGEEERRGYAEQTAWLRGKSLPDAEHALAERMATLEDNAYNRGGTQATADFIARVREFIAATG
jgi:hypothetical protein